MWNGRYRIEGLAHVARSVSSDKDSYNMHFVSHVETTVDGFAFCARRMGGPGLMGLARVARMVSFERDPYNVHF